jgi:hypothetical protein
LFDESKKIQTVILAATISGYLRLLFNWFAAIIDLNVYLLRTHKVPFKTSRQLRDQYPYANSHLFTL